MNQWIHLIQIYFILLQVAGYLKNLLSVSGLQLNLGLVQTAYANGSSTNYITNKLVYICLYIPNVEFICINNKLKKKLCKFYHIRSQ